MFPRLMSVAALGAVLVLSACTSSSIKNERDRLRADNADLEERLAAAQGGGGGASSEELTKARDERDAARMDLTETQRTLSMRTEG